MLVALESQLLFECERQAKQKPRSAGDQRRDSQHHLVKVTAVFIWVSRCARASLFEPRRDREVCLQTAKALCVTSAKDDALIHSTVHAVSTCHASRFTHCYASGALPAGAPLRSNREIKGEPWAQPLGRARCGSRCSCNQLWVRTRCVFCIETCSQHLLLAVLILAVASLPVLQGPKFAASSHWSFDIP